MQRRHHRQRQQLAEYLDQDEGQRGSDANPDYRADHREHDDLRQVDRKDVAPSGAYRLEGGDHVAAPIDVALDGIGHANPAYQERGEADQGEKLGEAIDGALELWRGAVAG